VAPWPVSAPGPAATPGKAVETCRWEGPGIGSLSGLAEGLQGYISHKISKNNADTKFLTSN
jgi:hypothetical protein